MNRQKLYENSIVFTRYLLVTAALEAVCCLLFLFVVGKSGFSSYAARIIIPLCSFIAEAVSSFVMKSNRRKQNGKSGFFIPLIAPLAGTVILHLIVYGFSLSKILFVLLYVFCSFLGVLFGISAGSLKR